jgi:hypothetical protein
VVAAEYEDPFLHAVVCLDPRDRHRVTRVAQAWLRDATRELFPDLARAAEGGNAGVKGSVMVCRTEADPLRGKKYGPQRLAEAVDALADDPLTVSVLFDSAARSGRYASARLTATRVVDKQRWVRLIMTATAGGDFDLAAESDRWVDFLAGTLDDADPAYGEIDDTTAQHLHTMLDLALRRGDSIETSRENLRGYSWVTVVPRELVDRLGGAAALSRSDAVTQVRPLASGGVLLRATPTPAEYDDAAMARMFRLVAPVLPAGRPRPLPGYPHLRVVYEDAAEAGVQSRGGIQH